MISNRAADDLTYIRSAMERSSAFTAVPGAGGVVTGVIGLIAAVVGARQPTGERWLATWLGAASIAVVVELAAMTLFKQSTLYYRVIRTASMPGSDLRVSTPVWER